MVLPPRAVGDVKFVRECQTHTILVRTIVFMMERAVSIASGMARSTNRSNSRIPLHASSSAALFAGLHLSDHFARGRCEAKSEKQGEPSSQSLLYSAIVFVERLATLRWPDFLSLFFFFYLQCPHREVSNVATAYFSSTLLYLAILSSTFSVSC